MEQSVHASRRDDYDISISIEESYQAALQDLVPEYTTSLDAAVPGEKIISVTLEEASGKWVAIHQSPDGSLQTGIGNTEVLARRIAGLKGRQHLQSQRAVPASDRFVGIDHNSDEFRRLISMLSSLEAAIRESNEYAAAAPEDRDRRLAEVNAGKGILMSGRKAAAAAAACLIPTLTYLALKFADVAIGELANSALGALQKLIGG